MASDTALAKAEAIKRFRSGVRLELSVAGDWVIGRHLDALKAKIDDELAQGGIPALDSGVGSWARQIADRMAPMIERELGLLLEAGDGSDSS